MFLLIDKVAVEIEAKLIFKRSSLLLEIIILLQTRELDTVQVGSLMEVEGKEEQA